MDECTFLEWVILGAVRHYFIDITTALIWLTVEMNKLGIGNTFRLWKKKLSISWSFLSLKSVLSVGVTPFLSCVAFPENFATPSPGSATKTKHSYEQSCQLLRLPCKLLSSFLSTNRGRENHIPDAKQWQCFSFVFISLYFETVMFLFFILFQ